MPENFLHFSKDTTCKYKNLSKPQTDKSKDTPRKIIANLLKTKNTLKILKALREKLKGKDAIEET